MNRSPKCAFSGLLMWLAGMCLLASGLLATEPVNDFRLAEDAYRTGAISYEEKLVRQLDYVFSARSESVALVAAETPAIKSATGLVMEVKDNWDNFSSEQQTSLAAYIGRPSMQNTYDSPAGYFKIHYNTVSPEEVPDQDDNGNSIPDIVERTALYFDSAYTTYIVHQGYLPPPSDGTLGGDDKYDVYLLSILSYGITYPDQPGDSAWNDFTSFISVHRNFYDFPANDDPEGDSIGAQKVTAAHEFYHAVQLAYDFDLSDNRWLMEESSTRMEDFVFPEVNDNYNYLTYFFSEPETNLIEIDGLHMYGAFVWPTYLDANYDDGVLRRVWEACRFTSSLAAIDSALIFYSVKVKDIFADFALWNYFTGSRAIPDRYYPDAADYDEVDIDLSFSTLGHDSILPLNGPDGLACNYVQFTVDDSTEGILEVTLDGSDMVLWALSCVISGGGSDTVLSDVSQFNLPIIMYYPHIGDYESVTAIPTVISAHLEENTYYLSGVALPYGDANYDRTVNVGDASYLISHIFKSGPGPQPVWQSGDANCDDMINVGDVVYLINYVFRGGPRPCADR